jgi:hypothetical protein
MMDDAFEDGVPVAAMDLDTFFFQQQMGDRDGEYADGTTMSVVVDDDDDDNDRNRDIWDDGSEARGQSRTLPRLPTLPMLSRQKPTPAPREDTFGGEFGDPCDPRTWSTATDEVWEERVQAYRGTDDEGVCHAIVAQAGYAVLASPMSLRRLVSRAIEGGPLPETKRLVPVESYNDNEDFAPAYMRLSFGCYAGPCALILKLPGHCLVLLASQTGIVLIDPRDQPAKPSPSGLPQLKGKGALVMTCHDFIEMSLFIRKTYQTKPSSASLFSLKKPKPALTEQTTEVTQHVESLSLDPSSVSIVDAMDEALRSSGAGNTAGVTASLDALLKTTTVSSAAPNVGADWKNATKMEKLQELFASDQEATPVAKNASSSPVLAPAKDEERNKEGKRERTPPTPPAAMGSPVRMESDDELVENADKPKRAKTPPLVPAPGAPTARTSGSAPAPSPSPVVKAERRKSAPKAARTSGVTVVAAVPAAAAPASTTAAAATLTKAK